MPRPTLRVPPRKYSYVPYRTQCVGFNTEFSLEDCRRKETAGTLNEDEQVYVDHIKSIGLW